MAKITHEPVKSVKGKLTRKTMIHTYTGNTYTLICVVLGMFDDYDLQIQYYLSNRHSMLFSGDSYGVPKHHDPLSEYNVNTLIQLLTLQDEDTGDDYFEDYTIEQLAFRDSPDCREINDEVTILLNGK